MRDGGLQVPPAVVAPPGPVPNYGIPANTFTPSKAVTLVNRSGGTSSRTKSSTPVRRPAPRQSTPVGSSRSGAIMPSAPAPAPPPGPPDINSFLAGDATYKSQQDALAKALADYKNQGKLQTDQYTGTYDQNMRQLKLDQTDAETNINDDYASRGLLNSGVFAKAFSDLQNQYADKQKSLDTDKANFLANLASATSNFESDQQLQLEKARQDAINRRAAQYGV